MKAAGMNNAQRRIYIGLAKREIEKLLLVSRNSNCRVFPLAIATAQTNYVALEALFLLGAMQFDP
jgi:hypothetical protein